MCSKSAVNLINSSFPFVLQIAWSVDEIKEMNERIKLGLDTELLSDICSLKSFGERTPVEKKKHLRIPHTIQEVMRIKPIVYDLPPHVRSLL